MNYQSYHDAESFGDRGGMHGNSATSALGRPSLESWDLFTRETLQNSWDARDQSSHEDGVTFSIDYRELTGHRAQTLRDFFGGDTLGLGSLSTLLYDSPGESIPLLVVSDTGTYGLQGPTSAAKAYTGRDDFVSFVRNIGRRAEKEMRGGTYGFGKGVFFNASEVDAVLVYSRTHDEHGNPVSRFIAMANSNGFNSGELNFTGRHWWGLRSEGVDGGIFAEPFTGISADSLARTFQLDLHFTDERRTGTSVAVLSPRFELEETEAVMQTIADALTKWAWPHMVATTEMMDPIDFSVTIDGRAIAIPDPERDPILRPFVQAYQLAIEYPEHTSRSTFVTEFQKSGMRKWVDVTSQRPIEYLGRLAVRETSTEHIQQKSVLSSDISHHVALMRGPRMVVNYWPGPKSGPEDNYAAVFIAASELDAIFAGSEPPAHDEWNSSTVNLKDERFINRATGKARGTNPVKIALQRIRDFLKSDLVAQPENISSGPNPALSSISNTLGTIVSSGAGTSTRVSAPRPATSRTKSSSVNHSNGVRTSVKLEGLRASDSGVVAIFRVGVSCTPKALENEVKIRVQTAVLVDGKRRTDAVDGIELATPLGWIPTHLENPDWNNLARNRPDENELVRVMRSATWEGTFAVLQPADSAIAADVVVEMDEE